MDVINFLFISLISVMVGIVALLLVKRYYDRKMEKLRRRLSILHLITRHNPDFARFCTRVFFET